MEVKELGGKAIEIDEDGFIQDPDAWDESVARSLAETEGVNDMTEIQHGANDPQALQADGLQAEGDLRSVSERTRQGRVQGGRASEAHRLRVIETRR
jgi:hypothetical protein